MVRKCQQCGRKGAVSVALAIELCEACETAIAAEVQTRVRIIQEALEILGNHADFSTKLTQCGRALREAEALHRYELRGILTTAPLPSTILADFRAKREALGRREEAA